MDVKPDPLGDAIIDAILAAPLSDASKKHYAASITRLTKVAGQPLSWILAHPDEAIAKWAIRETNARKQDTSLRTYVTVALTCFKYGARVVPQGVLDHRPRWMELFNEFDAKIREKYDNRVASERQLQSYLPWRTILQKREAIDKNSDAYLILCMYTMIEPARADYNMLRIFVGAPSQARIDEYPNHLIVVATERTVQSMTLVLNEFKSARSNSLPQYRRKLPAELQRVIVRSLKRNPREFLVVSPLTGKPYKDPHAYTVYVDRIFSRVLGKHVSINTLRHSFVNSLNLNEMSPKEMERTAERLMHSVGTMLRYRLDIPADKSPDGITKTCKVVCKHVARGTPV